jgi:hypothetical protein
MNRISNKLVSGTLGELLVQTRLLQYGVQAAPPLKDSGNDLIAVRGAAMRAVQVKATTRTSYTLPERKRQYHILAAVQLVGKGKEVKLDKCGIFLIAKEDLHGLPREFSRIRKFKLSARRIDELFPGPMRCKELPRGH